MEAKYSVINTCKGLLSKFFMSIFGAKVKQEVKPFLKPLICKIGEKTVMHDFLCLPECPMPLLGWDLLHKLGAQIKFEN